MKQYVEQTFGGGMKQDVESALQRPNTYRYASNGRLLYNRDPTDTTKGRSMAFSNFPGNLRSLVVEDSYAILGSVESKLGTVLFLTNGITSQIGLWAYDEEVLGVVVSGAYSIVYTDVLDPHLKNQPYRLRPANTPGQDRLNWIQTDEIDAEVTYENEQIERLYWTNRRSTKYTLNLRDKPTALQPNTGYYPSYWSRHAFRERSDVVFPLLKLLGRGRGRLRSGSYEICVQYRGRNGQRSAYSPVTRPVFVTAEPLDVYSPDGLRDDYLSQTLRSNHHNRVMSASGKVTGESLRWELKNLDCRWAELAVVVLYYETTGLPTRIVSLRPIPLAPAPGGQSYSLTVDVTQLDGEELTVAELNQVYDCVLKVGTLRSENNRLFEGNLTRLKPFGFEVSTVRFDPVLKSVTGDYKTEPIFDTIPNAVTGRDDNDPITNSLVQDGLVQRHLFGGLYEPYAIHEDFLNDKGQVWNWLHGSHFRGETYEYGSLVFDRLGQPMFVIPLPAFTFPQQYTPGPAGQPDYYSLTQKNDGTGLYDLRIMGVEISGLRLPVDSLYDQDGLLNASGFMIVRRKRQPRTAHQGVLFPVCWGDSAKDGRNYKPFPLPYLNYFDSRAGKPNRFAYSQLTEEDANDNFIGTYSQPYYGVYHSPDVLIEGSFNEVQPGDTLQHVGIAGQAYANPVVRIANFGQLSARHLYAKSYATGTQFPRVAVLNRASRPKPGDTSRISFALVHNQGFDFTYNAEGKAPFDRDDLNLKFETQTHPLWDKIGPGNLKGDGLLERNAVLLKTSDWIAVDIAESEARPANFRLVNYLVVPDVINSQTEPYHPVGHFQPITPELLTYTDPVYDAQGVQTHYEFNGIEVWGGDAYVNYFDFTRIYPFWSDTCEKHDYSLSHIVPIESKYNLMLRTGRSFAKNAVRPEATACEEFGQQFRNGVSAGQPEDWSYNRVLLVDTSVNTYGVQPRDYRPITDDPVGFSWTPVKQGGQVLDAWRLRLAGDAGQGDGTMGAFTQFVRSETQGLYAWHTHGIELLPLEALELRANDAGTILTSSGAVFHRGIPISRKYGTVHPGSIWQHNGQMGGWDARMGVLLRHTPGGLDLLSQSENLDDLVKTLTLPLSAASENALTGWHCQTGVDVENGEVLLTFTKAGRNPLTLTYSVSLNEFTGEYPVYASRYVRRARLLLSVNARQPNELWAHNRGRTGEWYGQFYPTVLRFVVNPQATQNKTFNNGAINVNGEGWSKITTIRHSTPNGGPLQNHVLTPTGDDRFRWFKNTLLYPMHEEDWSGEKERLRDHYMTVEIEITNDASNTPVSITSFRTTYSSAEQI